MIIQAFRNSQAINLVFLFFATFILRLPLYFLSTIPLIPIPEEPLSGFLFGLISPILIIPLFNIIFSSLLIYLQAVMINVMCRQYNILYKSTYLPGLMYVVFSSLFNIFLYTNTVLFANFFVILLIGQLFSLYKSNFSYQSVFLSGLIVATGTLFYFPLLLVFPIIWVSLFILRPFNWREWVISVIGLLIPALFVWSYYFIINKISVFARLWMPLKSQFPVSISIQYTDYLVLIPIIIVLLLSFIAWRTNFYKNIIQVRKSQQVLFIIPFFLGISFYLKSNYSIAHLQLLSAPMAVFLAYYFISAKKKWVYESLFIIICSFIYIFQII